MCEQKILLQWLWPLVLFYIHFQMCMKFLYPCHYIISETSTACNLGQNVAHLKTDVQLHSLVF